MVWNFDIIQMSIFSVKSSVNSEITSLISFYLDKSPIMGIKFVPGLSSFSFSILLWSFSLFLATKTKFHIGASTSAKASSIPSVQSVITTYPSPYLFVKYSFWRFFFFGSEMEPTSTCDTACTEMPELKMLRRILQSQIINLPHCSGSPYKTTD